MNVWLASNITAIALAFGMTVLSKVPPVTADDLKVRRVGSAIGGAGLVSTFFWLIAWVWVWLVWCSNDPRLSRPRPAVDGNYGSDVAMNEFGSAFRALMLAEQSARDFHRDEVNRLCREISEKANHLANLVKFHEITLDKLQDTRLANATSWIEDTRWPHLAPKWPATVAEDMAKRDVAAPDFRERPNGNCPDCGGTGEIGAQMDYLRCATCHGTGDVYPAADSQFGVGA